MADSFTIRVEGVESIRNELDRKLRDIPALSMSGLVKGGLLIQRESQKKAPIDTGNLRSSAFTVWTKGRLPSTPRFKGTGKEATNLSGSFVQASVEAKGEVEAQGRFRFAGAVAVGFGAFYALYVHEDMAAHHMVGQAKFLESALAENQKTIVDLVRKEAEKGTK